MSHDYTSETLYYKAPSGTIRTWYAVVSGCYYATITGESGREGNQSAWTEVSGKNLNRSNELSPENAALAKAKSMIADKLASGYVDSMSKLEEQSKVPRAMLAKPKFADELKRIEPAIASEKCVIQPKLDGFRCLASKAGLFSRNLRKIETCDHIWEALMPFFDMHPEVVVDGEIYNHEYHNNFGQLQSLITKKDLDIIDWMEVREKLQFHVYDFVSPKPFIKRFSTYRKDLPNVKCIQKVKTLRATSVEHIYEKHSSFTENGYEGSMIRISGPGYEQNKRAGQLVKLKDFQDEEFTVIAIMEGQGAWAGAAKSVACKDDNGNTFSAGCSGTKQYLTHVQNNGHLFLGGKVTVAFQEKFPTGVPRFPIVKKFHTR